MNREIKRFLGLLLALMVVLLTPVSLSAQAQEHDTSNINKSIGLTKEEADFVMQCEEITVAFPGDHQPLSYYNEEEDRLEGIMPDIMNAIALSSGLRFRYVLLPNDTTPIAYAVEHPDSLVAGARYTGELLQDNAILTSKPCVVSRAALAVLGERADTIVLSEGSYTLGISPTFIELREGIQQRYPRLILKEYASDDEGLKAVVDGEIDLFAQDVGVITPRLCNPRFSSLDIIEHGFMTVPNSIISASTSRNERLLGIVEKAIAAIPSQTLSRIEEKNLRLNIYHYNAEDTLYRYRYTLLTVGASVSLVIACLVIVLLVRQHNYAQKLLHHAERDMMTEVYNRETARSKISRLLAKNAGSPCAFLLIDIDDLKNINDTYGHIAGDEAILGVAHTLCSQFRGTDIVSRLGGDEFAVFLMGIHTQQVMEPILKRTLNAIAATVIAGGACKLHCCIGAAMDHAGAVTLEELYQHADEALYSAKNSGKSAYAFYDEMAETTQEARPKLSEQTAQL